MISERVLKGRDEGKNVVEECEERMSLVSLLCCEYLLSNDEKKNEFMRDVLFSLSTSLLDISHFTPKCDEADLFLTHLFSLLQLCCEYPTYRSLLCCEKGRLQFGRILSMCNESGLDETRGISLELLRALFSWGEESEVAWMVKEGGIRTVIRRVREKEERNRHFMHNACWAAAEFLRPYSDPIRRLREEWKGKKEWREVMWMMEEEGEIDSMCGRAIADDEYKAQEVLNLLGICCPE
jgi:hypothetical protein